MSLRNELVRLGLRWFIKRRSRGQTLESWRRELAGMVALIPQPPAGTQVAHLDADGVRIHRIATPATRDTRHVLYLHGGAYVSGGPAHYRHFTWRIASAAQACVWVPEYRLAPEHPFPAAVEDAVTAYRWLTRRGIHPPQIAVMGDSAGGGLMFAHLLKLRDEGILLPAAAVALSPWTDLALASPSLQRNARADPMLCAAQVPGLARFYLGGADPRMPYASPVYGDPAGLPPSLIHVGSDEILRDDAVRMADRLQAAGCEVTLEVWPRMPHVWHLLAPFVPEAGRAIRRIGDFLRGRLADEAQAAVRGNGIRAKTTL